MVDQQSDDWLPAGWTVEVNVRKNGKKDRCYTAPSGELKFHSKVEVSRYLNAEQIKHAEFERKKKGRHKLSERNALVEEVTAEGLPSGWIKEIKVRRKARAIRRDPYYTDPISGYVFRSLKDALRYLNTGELGRLAFKPKDGCSSDLKAEYDKVSSHPVAKEHNSSNSGNCIEVVTDRGLKSNGIIQDMQNLKSACVGECTLSQHFSDQCAESTDLSSFNMPEAKDSKQLEGKVDFSGSNSTLVPAVVALPERKPSEHIHHLVVRRGKLEGRKEPNLPRRSSKRLAGIELDPTPELKTSNRIRKNASRSSNAAETSPADGFSLGSQELDQLQAETEANYTFNTSKSTEELVQANTLKNLSGDITNSEKHDGEAETDNITAEIQASVPDLSLGSQTPFVEHVEMVNTNNNTDGNPGGSPLGFAIGGSWSDPCIEFAVKTLTGAIDLDTNNNTDGNPGGSPLGNPCGDSWSDPCIEFAVKTLTGAVDLDTNNNIDGNPGGSPLGNPFGDSWSDPCIEFAVKTLTGAVDLDIQDYFYHQINSSQGDSSLQFPNFGLNNSCPTDLWSQQFNTAEKPTLPCPEQKGLQSSGDKLGEAKR